MFFARKILFYNFILLSVIYVTLTILNLNNVLYFDYFGGFFIFSGFYLLTKSVCYLSDSSFFVGGSLFLTGMFLISEIKFVWIFIPLIFMILSFLSFVFFDSKLMKFAFYCSIPINIITLAVYLIF